MIEKDYNLYVLVCDVCGESAGVYDSFDEAVEAKKAGWKSKADKGVWIDICPECQKVDK